MSRHETSSPFVLKATLKRGAGHMGRPNGAGQAHGASKHKKTDQSFWGHLHSLILEKGCQRLNGRPTSFQTRHNLRQGLCRLMAVLQEDYPIEHPTQFDGRHLAHLYGWLQQRFDNHLKGKQPSLSPSTVSDYTSYLRALCRWIDRPDLQERIGLEFTIAGATKRRTAAQSDSSWEGVGLDVGQVVDAAYAIEPFVGMALLAQHAFGLRRKEALCFSPSSDYRGNYLAITRGSKGGRSRMVFLTERWQHEVAAVLQHWLIECGKPLAPIGGVQDLARQLRRYSYVLTRLGITKEGVGTTGHGLRAGFACRLLQNYGVTPPVRGGAQLEAKEQRDSAYSAATEALGHGRRCAMNAYVGAKTTERNSAHTDWDVRQIAQINMPEILSRVRRAATLHQTLRRDLARADVKAEGVRIPNPPPGAFVQGPPLERSASTVAASECTLNTY